MCPLYRATIHLPVYWIPSPGAPRLVEHSQFLPSMYPDNILVLIEQDMPHPLQTHWGATLSSRGHPLLWKTKGFSLSCARQAYHPVTICHAFSIARCLKEVKIFGSFYVSMYKLLRKKISFLYDYISQRLTKNKTNLSVMKQNVKMRLIIKEKLITKYPALCTLEIGYINCINLNV